MESVIARLQIDIDTLIDNEAVARRDDRMEDADKKVKEIAEIEEAIEILRQNQLSSLPALEAVALKYILENAMINQSAYVSAYKTLLEAIQLRRDLNL